MHSLGACTVKYTTSLPCIGSSESDSKLYTNFKFREGKFHKHLKNTINLQRQAIYVDKRNRKKNSHIF